MKPTQEQLNDPAWWDENVHDDFDYAFTTGPYWCADLDQSIVGNVEFATEDGGQGFFKLTLRNDHWVLLAKRPTKPAFVPEVGVECEFMDGDKWFKCKIEYISDDYIVVLTSKFNNYEALRKGYYEFRPIKSERELFIEKLASLSEGYGSLYSEDFAGAVYDSGLFKLVETEK